MTARTTKRKPVPKVIPGVIVQQQSDVLIPAAEPDPLAQLADEVGPAIDMLLRAGNLSGAATILAGHGYRAAELVPPEDLADAAVRLAERSTATRAALTWLAATEQAGMSVEDTREATAIAAAVVAPVPEPATSRALGLPARKAVTS